MNNECILKNKKNCKNKLTNFMRILLEPYYRFKRAALGIVWKWFNR